MHFAPATGSKIERVLSDSVTGDQATCNGSPDSRGTSLGRQICIVLYCKINYSVALARAAPSQPVSVAIRHISGRYRQRLSQLFSL